MPPKKNRRSTRRSRRSQARSNPRGRPPRSGASSSSSRRISPPRQPQPTPTGTDHMAILVSISCLEGGCRQIAQNQEALEGHLLKDHLHHKCLFPKCTQKYTNKADLHDHAKQHPKKHWRCPKRVPQANRLFPVPCMKVASSHDELQSHLEESHQLQVWQCGHQDCGYTFDCKETVVRHFREGRHLLESPSSREDALLIPQAVPSPALPSPILPPGAPCPFPQATLVEIDRSNPCYGCGRRMDEVVCPDYRKNACGHAFHEECIMRMYREGDICNRCIEPFRPFPNPFPDDDDDEDSSNYD